MLRYASLGALGLLGSSALAASAEWVQEQVKHFERQDIFNRIVRRPRRKIGVSCPSAS